MCCYRGEELLTIQSAFCCDRKRRKADVETKKSKGSSVRYSVINANRGERLLSQNFGAHLTLADLGLRRDESRLCAAALALFKEQ